ncbi:hypothetical protein DPMN_153356 [Dreissena polymorpha]|uniref:Sacsin/Nov domain-containing protein n=1 Tax=Dreissena polymorpha TaxID=45954 RepID=A0A9D4FPT0_DREPO|nr:hypothetical protein DPMN_153356 [Dreissena polymorpha]
MKGVDKILPENIYDVAKTIDAMSKLDYNMCDKAKALQEYIEHNPGVLRKTLWSGKHLGNEIKDLSCFVYCSSEECEWNNRFPQLLKWFSTKSSVCCPGDMKEIKFWQLVCSSVPLIKTRSTEVSLFYDWNTSPSTEKILLHLKSIQQYSISTDMTLELLTVIKTIYQALSKQSTPIVKEALVSNALVWTSDNNFHAPSKVIMQKNDDDIQLKPYMYFLSQELGSNVCKELKTFFTWLGCHSRQDENVLVRVLHDLKNKYLNSKVSEAEIKTDLKCAQMILERLAEANIDLSWASDNILMVVQSNSDQTIKFARLSECVYDDDPTGFNDVVDGENICYVHAQIPLRTAEKLGVKSVTRHALAEAQDFDHWGQHESFTTRLRSLLRDGYTDGLSVPKELLQNADDAGATEICFVYDERKHSDSRDRLLSKSLSDFQGSALWCYNNKVFSEKDLRNIIKFNNSAKSEDVTTIGKFGLGFNAVYNITDIPSFISGADMVIFDPHEKYLDDNSTLKRSNGKRIPLSKRTLVKRHIDQFKPFQGMFGCNVLDDPFEPYQGTLFRFPLRTAQEADQSEICKTVYSHSEVQSLLVMLMKSADKLLLFCQNVLSLKLFHISANATSSTEMKTVYMAQKDSFRHSGKCCTRLETGILKKVASVHENQCDFGMEEHHTIKIRQTFYEHASLFPNRIYSGADLNVTWLVTWVSKNGPKQLKHVDAVPLVAVATLCKTEHDWACQPLETLTKGNYDTGHMFCFLPLPIKTGLSFHINGCFRVSDDRQRLTLLNEDDKTSGSKFIFHAWNIFLLQDPLVTALLSHIQITNRFCQRNEDAYRAWPHNFNPDVLPFVASLYRAVIDQNKPVFRDQSNNMPFSKILILEKKIFTTHVHAFFDFLLNVPFGIDRTVVYVPDFVCSNLRLFNKDKAPIVERAFISKTDALVHFLHHISDPYWTNKETVRNNLLAWTIMEADEKVKQCFKTIACITTQPFGRLRSVLDLVHPESQLAKMFFDTDERFISKCKNLNEPKIYTKLVEFGMNFKSLPTDLIFDRCASLEDLSKKCLKCTRIRMGHLLKYLAESDIPKATFDKLQHCRILPVLQKPFEWSFTWEADTNVNHLVCEIVVNCSKHKSKKNSILVLGKPEGLFRQDCYSTVGCIHSIVDEKDRISSTLLKNLGVKDSHHLTISVVMEQLHTVGNEFEDGKYTGETHKIIDNIYKALDGLTNNMPKDTFQNMIASDFSSTLSKPIIEVDKTLVSIDKIAKCSLRSCPPYLYGLPELVAVSRWRIFEKLGVRECFSVSDIIRVLEIKAQENKQNVHLNIKEIVKILENLVQCMNREKKTYDDIKQYEECIIAPDREGRFLPTSQLALEDIEMPTKTRLFLLHDDISPSLGRAIGVRSKQLQLIRQYTRAIPFGQSEKLTTRLNNLLKEYPRDETIMKELIQNADDACAREIHFIKYYENKRVGKSLEHGNGLQPALCVYNDSCFSENDFEGIQNLGIGSKTNDPSKTGKFGVGFNAVYHITDTPSFLTKGPGLGEHGHVCMFDPLFKHITDISDGQPGIRYNVDDLKDDFPDTTIGFPPMPGTRGTMFRLPLRQEESVISNSCLTTLDVDGILKSCINVMPDCLHFLKHIRKIKILKYENGKYTEEYKVESELIDVEDNKRQADFFNAVNEVIISNVSKKENIFIIKPFNVLYKLRIHDTKNIDTTWLVVHQFGANFDSGTRLESIQNLLRNDDLSLLPLGGVSLKLCSGNVKDFFKRSLKRIEQEKEIAKQTKAYPKPNNNLTWDVTDGTVYCFLPLPVLTGLPLNINGHFSVDRARRGLWEEGYRMEWNRFLLSTVVTEATISALNFLKAYWIDCNMDLLINGWFLRKSVQIYFNHFPRHECTQHSYWQFFVEEFYRFVIENQIHLFPCVSEMQTKQGEIRDQRFRIEWIHLATNLECIKGAVVDTLWKRCSSKEQEFLIKKMLWDMNVKVASVHQNVVETMGKAGQKNILKTDPWAVMQIVKDRVSTVNCYLQETIIGKINVAISILRYIQQDDRFDAEIHDLPLCITNDNFLRKYSKESNLFCSQYCAILPGSFERFLHYDLVPLLYREKLFEDSVFLRFTFVNFVELLPLSYNPEILCSGENIKWKSSDHNPMEPNTVRLLWAFILEESKRSTAKEKKQNVNVFVRNLATISGWAFLPLQVTIQDHCIYELIPIERAYTLLSGYYNADIRTIAEKANIGTLDSSVFKDKTSIDNEVIDKLKGLISSQYKPDQLLLCVHYHKSKLLSCNITSDEAFKLLRVFDQSTNILTKKLKGQAKILLRELPLYETMQQGSFVSLDEVEDVVVSSSKMPPEGLNEWAHSQGKVVVKENILLKDLYTFLELPHNNDLDLYVRNIFPNMTHMPRQFWLAHVVYVKDHMLLTQLGRHFSKMQKRLIELVNNLPFIDIEGHFYCAHELYDRSHPVFATMLSEEQFLPAHFMDDNWKDFMEIIGLNIRPTGAMMLDYARQIARNGAMGVNEDLIAASNVIVSCLFGDFDDKLENDVFISIKGIKFVVPYTISSEMENIFRAYCSEKIFICFEGSCSGKSADICWTSASLTKRDPDEKQMNLLEITQEPQVDSVIKHCQNICSVFDDDFKREQTQHQNKVFYMERIYRFLERNTHQINARLLESIPVILIPEEAMVKASNVFVSAPERVELRPYLYKVPHKFERYIEFFKKLGASPEPTCLQYANVLRMIKDQFVNEEPPANILDVVSKAIQYFFESISTKTGEVRKHFESITHLYLPNQKRILMNSSELTVSDNDTFREELEERCNLSTFLGFTELNIQFNHLKDPFELLPKALQPRLLTDDVEEVISTENIIEVNSAEAEHVQRFVCSDQFFEGLCRLIQHDEVQNVDDELQDMLLHIGIKEVSGLKILLRYKGHMVEGVEIESDSNLQQTTLVDSESGKEIVCYSLFYQTDISENFGNMNSALRAGLMSLIEKCTHKQLSRESLLLLPQILDLYREPDIIGRFLDRNRIQKLDNISKRNLVVFPSPGTYVEERFYRFMVQKITPFRIHEFNYVALEIENDENNDSANSARFIYAHIEEEFRSDNTSTLHLRYSVHIGYNRGGTIVVPIFRLFKFIPLTTVTSQEVVEYDSEPISSIPFDTNCQRIMDELQEAFENFNIQDRRRIIRRMLLRWHPDRNPDHEEYSKRVFFFIQNCILRLERGEQLNLQPEPQMPDMRGSRYWNVCVDATNTGHVHTRGYQENLEEFNMFNRRGPHMYSPVSSPGEYRRWIRQAKRDFQTGQSHLNCAENHPDTYNWICYNCHQVIHNLYKFFIVIQNKQCLRRVYRSPSVSRSVGQF